MNTERPVETLSERLLQTAARLPEKRFLVSHGEEWTYDQFLDRAMQIARALAGSGVSPGQSVGLLMPTCPNFAAGFFGAMLAGARVIPINTRFQRGELKYVIQHSEISVLLTTDLFDEHVNLTEKLNACFPELADPSTPGKLDLDGAPNLRMVVVLGNEAPGRYTSEGNFLAKAVDIPAEQISRRSAANQSTEIALIPYTSGTTAKPKACMLTHASLVRMWDAIGERLGITEQSTIWCSAPMYHAVGYGTVLLALSAGGTALSQTHYSAEEAANLFVKYQPDVVYGPFYQLIEPTIEYGRRRGQTFDHIRILLYIPTPGKFDEVQALIGNGSIVTLYGLTESTAMVTLTRPTDSAESRRDTCGTVLPGIELRIADPETRTEVPTGQPGEILFRGYNAFAGYFKDPQLTAAVIDSEGWVSTGDLGVVDESGHLSYVGRIKDMLKVGGENVAASEVEAVLGSHPDVVVAQVVGMPDDRLGEVPVAFVEKAAGSALEPQDLIKLCANEIATYKVPRRVWFVAEWPMSATKVQKAKLREALTVILDSPHDRANVIDWRAVELELARSSA